MFCQNCGALIQEGATFCDDCHRRMYDRQESAAPGDACARQPGTPPVSEYLGQQSTRPQYAGSGPLGGGVAASRSAGSARLSAGLSWGTLAIGALIICTTFLPWISTGIEYWSKPSGWTFVAHGGEMGGNFIWIKIPGFLYFSGVWSILVGLAVIAGSVMLLMRAGQGRFVSGIGAVLGVGAATVNIVMTYSYQAGVGIGVWLFGVLSVLAVVCTELAWRYST